MLRALAVILVIYNHSMIIGSDNKYAESIQRNFLFLRHWTSIGLDLFFVISGLIMTIVTQSYLKKPSGWFNFFLKRMLRIIPLYWLYSIVVYFERYFLKHPVEPGEIAKTILFFPIFAAKDAIYPIIGQGWSLTYEMYFYILIVVFLFFKSKNIFRVLLATLLILAIGGYFINPANVSLKFICTPILLEFALGVAVGIGYHYVTAYYQKLKLNTVKTLSVTATIIGLLLMLASLFYNSEHISNPFYVITDNTIAMSRSLIWGVPCSIFVFGLLFMELSFNLQIPKSLIKIGDASFSGYLVHILVIITVGKLYSKFGFNNGDAFIIIASILSILASLPLYQYIEKPLLNISNKLVFSKHD